MTAITAALARIADDPAGALRSVWDDTGARFAIIAALLLGGLNIGMSLADAGSTTGTIVDGEFADTGVWVAMTISLMFIARALVMRPLSGGLDDPANITLLVSIIATIVIQFGMGFGLGGAIAQYAVDWPWVLMHAGTVFGARLIGPHLRNPLVLWAGLTALLMYGVNAITAQGPVYPPSGGAGSIWVALQAGSAIVALAIAGRGFGGPIARPLNVATALFIFFTAWFETAAHYAGINADPLGAYNIFWPWTLIDLAFALLAAALAKPLSRRLGAPDDA